MFRRDSSKKKKMVSTSQKGGHNRHLSTTQFKSKLALALSNGDSNPSEKNLNVQRGEYKLLENILNENELPLNVFIKNFSPGNSHHSASQQQQQHQQRYNGVATIQIVQDRATLNCIGPDGSEIELPIKMGNHATVNFLSTDNTALYKTIGEIRCRRREQNIQWFTSTKEFTAEKDHFYAGQIFSFAQQGLLSSFKRDRNTRGVTVYAYPSSRKYYLPLSAEGDFRKCDAPDVTQTVDLHEIAKSENFPYFVCIQASSDSTLSATATHLNSLAGKNLFVRSKTGHKYVYITRKFRGSLQIHSFPVTRHLFAKTVSARRPLDRLDHTEKRLVLRSFELNGKRDEKGYCIKTYNEIGIIRLLEEIFLELNQGGGAGTYTKLSTLKNLDRRSIQKRVIKTYLRHHDHNNNCINATRNQSDTSNKLQQQQRYLQSVDGVSIDSGDITNNENGSCCDHCERDDVKDKDGDHNYVNSSLFDEDETELAKRRTRELVLEFDDGGYVIIPFAGNSPKISVAGNSPNKKTSSSVTKTAQQRKKAYQSSDNVAYNYQEQSFDSTTTASDSFDGSENIYDETNDSNDGANKVNGDWDFLSTEDGEEIYNQLYDLTCDQHVYTYIDSGELSSPAKESPTEGEEQHYDYSYTGNLSSHFLTKQTTMRTTPTMSRSNVRKMNLNETCDLLRVNLMQHHVTVFQQHLVDGLKLDKMTERDFVEQFNMTRFEAKKMACYLDGWRPKKPQQPQQPQQVTTWLSKLVKDWTCVDVTQYLQHINMISLQRFTQRHSVDGFLLKQILTDCDVIESLTSQHSLVLKRNEIERLRDYVMEDEKPRFKFFN